MQIQKTKEDYNTYQRALDRQQWAMEAAQTELRRYFKLKNDPLIHDLENWVGKSSTPFITIHAGQTHNKDKVLKAMNKQEQCLSFMRNVEKVLETISPEHREMIEYISQKGRYYHISKREQFLYDSGLIMYCVKAEWINYTLQDYLTLLEGDLVYSVTEEDKEWYADLKDYILGQLNLYYDLDNQDRPDVVQGCKEALSHIPEKEKEALEDYAHCIQGGYPVNRNSSYLRKLKRGILTFGFFYKPLEGFKDKIVKLLVESNSRAGARYLSVVGINPSEWLEDISV